MEKKSKIYKKFIVYTDGTIEFTPDAIEPRFYHIPCGYVHAKYRGVRESVHRLVAYCFLEKKPEHIQVNHINGIKDDNRVENLEGVTAKENMKHCARVLKKTKTRKCIYKGKEYRSLTEFYEQEFGRTLKFKEKEELINDGSLVVFDGGLYE